MNHNTATTDATPLGLSREGFAKLVHDLRTPLTGVIGLTQLLRSGVATAVSADAMLEMMQRSAEHMLGLVNDILDLASQQAGTVALTPARADLRQVLANVQAMTAPQSSAKGLQLRMSADDDLPTVVQADARRLTQVLTNLTANAIDFTTEGTVSLRLRRAAAPAGDGRSVAVCFEVRDSGIGMTAEEMARVFQPFVQAAAGMRRGGNGLGLAICRELVERMGGRIELDSTPGVGSCFRFTLVFERADLADSVVPPAASATSPCPTTTQTAPAAPAAPAVTIAQPVAPVADATAHASHSAPAQHAAEHAPALSAGSNDAIVVRRCSGSAHSAPAVIARPPRRPARFSPQSGWIRVTRVGSSA